VCYQTAYLKANWPAEFMAALISSEIGNFDKMPGFIQEAQAMDIAVLPPDVNSSGERFRPVETGIRYGLAGIKGVGAGAARAVAAERAANGPFTSLTDFCSRVDSQAVNRKAIESLAQCGAFDALGMHRARIFNGIDFAMARAAERQRDRESGQGSLFDLLDDSGPAADTSAGDDVDFPECECWHANEQLAHERALLGIYMSGHPLAQVKTLVQRYQLHAPEQVATLAEHTVTRVAGIAAVVTRKVTKKRENMAILRLEGLEGAVEVVVFPETYARYGDRLITDAVLLVCGTVSFKGEQVSLQAAEIHPIDEAAKHFTRDVRIHITPAQAHSHLPEVRDIIKLHPGETPVIIGVCFPTGEKVFCETDRLFRVNPGQDFVHAVEHVLGEDTVYVNVSPDPLRFPDESGNRRFRRQAAG